MNIKHLVEHYGEIFENFERNENGDLEKIWRTKLSEAQLTALTISLNPQKTSEIKDITKLVGATSGIKFFTNFRGEESQEWFATFTETQMVEFVNFIITNSSVPAPEPAPAPELPPMEMMQALNEKAAEAAAEAVPEIPEVDNEEPMVEVVVEAPKETAPQAPMEKNPIITESEPKIIEPEPTAKKIKK